MSNERHDPVIIKVGGALLDDRQAQKKLFAELKTLQRPWVLLHGGGALVDKWLGRLNLPVERCRGLRVSPAQQMPFIAGALAGCANTELVAQACHAGISAIGLSMVDAGCSAKVLAPELGCVGRLAPLTRNGFNNCWRRVLNHWSAVSLRT